MKNKIAWAAICLSLALGLGACTRADKGSSGQTSGASGTTGAGTVTSSDASGAAGTSGGADAAGGQQDTAAAEAVGGTGNAQAGGAQADALASGGAQAGGSASGDASVSGEETYDAQNQSGDGASAAPAGAADEGWDGTFVSPSGETLTISTVDEFTIAFSFAQSGISGSASADGDEAVFGGDDGVTVTFDNQGGSVEVFVTNAEGEDEASTIGGNFMRQ